MAVLDRKELVSYSTGQGLQVTKAEASTLEGTGVLQADGQGVLPKGIRLLLKAQEDPSQNGIYEVASNPTFANEGKFAGSGKFAESTSWVLKRTADADSGADVTDGMMVPVALGQTQKRTTWIQVHEDPIEVGTTPLIFEELWASPGGTAGGALEGQYASPSLNHVEGIRIEVAA